VRAVVSRGIGQCAVEELRLRPVGAHDVLVRIEASGICHSDISVADGTLDGPLPAVLGHEGAGTVVGTGPAVTGLRAGDRVVLVAVAPCGRCPACGRGESNLCRELRDVIAPAFLDGDVPVRGVSGLGTLADELVVDERAAVRVDTDLPAVQLAVIGCAVLTGAGAIVNIAATRAGDRVLVVGAGGVGLAAVQAAVAVGATAIVAVDPSAEARRAALACGATQAVDPASASVAPELTDVSRGAGFDVTLDCVGSPATFDLAWRQTRRGGHLVVIGVPPANVTVSLPIADVARSGRRISGCVYGGSSVHRDVPMYVDLAHAGRLHLDRLVGRTIELGDVPDIVRRGGHGPGRTVVVNG
jgi:S-(hydroxymethyl)glutathione dehydrogenase/alcohol dehydrogenase